MALFRPGRGDYFYTISELTRFGIVTVRMSSLSVCKAVGKCLWEDHVTIHFLKNEEEFKEKAVDMEELKMKRNSKKKQ